MKEFTIGQEIWINNRPKIENAAPFPGRIIDWTIYEGKIDTVLALTPRHHPFGRQIYDRSQFEAEMEYNSGMVHHLKFLTFTEALQYSIASVRLDFIQ